MDLEKLKQVIQKANPERDYKYEYMIGTDQIRIADVLVAMQTLKNDSYFIDSNGGFHEWFSPKGRLDLRTVAYWNIKNDSLDHQSDETKQFLIDLLINNV